ncbi:hypothetical protein RhiirA5_372618 [Rhizophagus irregularis]|uniref:Uncharacterized protein n=1 Tax=Rhizophagus irregularis TaxID=588596 RepID=A0A2I1E201_9GLOM|nr:hypothetical protein RhiirA5_372618 [Rhizophagus irregularis]PKY16164.1 hypothetical protein RhiirB3_381524 [Rhizophagus irregularis]CAB5174162.1 unnamed protein product [Rhizophagus irregularis]CAB5312152.1 unnamed protein product [Rhizophagus irregularis]
MESKAIHIISKFLNPIPQYVLGCLPAIAIMGASPKEKFAEKLAWVLRCLGCPFTGLLYSCNVGKDEVKLCIYWLSSKYFSSTGQRNQQLQQLKHRPVGVYAMSVDKERNEFSNIVKYINRYTARASVLDRMSSLVSTYYILVGIIAAISRTTGINNCEDWPFIPLLLSWTIPAILKRVISGTLVVKDPNCEFELQDIQIIMKPGSESYRKHKLFSVTLVAFVSIVYPWLTVFLAIYTPPIGYYCRSQYLTIICSIWSINSALAYINHLIKEHDVEGNEFLHAWFSIWGFIVAILLLFLALLTNNIEWWSILHEEHCRTTCEI